MRSAHGLHGSTDHRQLLHSRPFSSGNLGTNTLAGSLVHALLCCPSWRRPSWCRPSWCHRPCLASSFLNVINLLGFILFNVIDLLGGVHLDIFNLLGGVHLDIFNLLNVLGLRFNGGLRLDRGLLGFLGAGRGTKRSSKNNQSQQLLHRDTFPFFRGGVLPAGRNVSCSGSTHIETIGWDFLSRGAKIPFAVQGRQKFRGSTRE